MQFETPQAVRQACRDGAFSSQTSGQAPGYAQANLCILPREYAFDFLLFCQRNPKPCPLLHVLEAGQFLCENNIDIRTDLPRYRVYKDGQLTAEVTDLKDLWQDDFVTFVIGCSFSFEEALAKGGLEVRHNTERKNVPMYNTSVPCKAAGMFHGNMVVSMRPFTPDDAIRATTITNRYPGVHGAPVHIGDPHFIGIEDISSPDYGDAPTIHADRGEVPVFWACGVTPQAVVMASMPRICITHAPGHMLLLNTRNEELAT